jgi:hypothetical protein
MKRLATIHNDFSHHPNLRICANLKEINNQNSIRKHHP